MSKEIKVQLTAIFKRSAWQYNPQFLINGILIESLSAYSKRDLKLAFELTEEEFNKLIA